MRGTGYLVLGCLLALGGSVLGQDIPVDREALDSVEEDLQEVLAAYAEAGQEVNLSALPDSVDSWGPSLDGMVSLWAASVAQETDLRGRFLVQAAGLTLRGKGRQGAGPALDSGLALSFARGNWTLRTGGLGLSAGYGLLLAGPGRRSGLAAAASFPSPRVRLRGWSSTPEERSVFGVGIDGQVGRWHLAAAQGAPGQNSPGTGYGAFCLGRQGEVLDWTLAGVAASGLDGLSLSGSVQEGARRWAWEMAWKQDDQGGPRTMAWLGSGRWDPRHGWCLEVQMAGSTGQEGPWTGDRPAVLGTWSGWGWAGRLKGQLRPGTTLAVLLAHNEGSEQETRVRREDSSTAEILLRVRPASRWLLSLQWRARRDRQWAWSEDYPWLPAALDAEKPRTNLRLQVERRLENGDWRLAFRRLQQGYGEERSARALLEWKGRRLVVRNLGLTLHQVWAWGQEVDLVTAIVPVPGLVRPRHWGRWTSETVLSLSWRPSSLVLAVGLSRRLAEVGEGEEDEFSSWLHAKLLW